jgi:hypothetical protein
VKDEEMMKTIAGAGVGVGVTTAPKKKKQKKKNRKLIPVESLQVQQSPE